MQFKFILVLENGYEFVQHKFKEERIDASAAINWYPLSSRTRTDNVKMITRSDMMLNDNFAHVGDLLVENLKGFKAHKEPNRELPYRNRMWNAITYELSRDQIKYYRRVYSVLDLMSDLGGLYGSLTPVCMTLVYCLQYRSSYQFVMNDMFVDRKDDKIYGNDDGRPTTKKKKDQKMGLKQQ